MDNLKWLILGLLICVMMSACMMEMWQQKENAEKNPFYGVKEVVLPDGTKCALYKRSVNCNWKN